MGKKSAHELKPLLETILRYHLGVTLLYLLINLTNETSKKRNYPYSRLKTYHLKKKKTCMEDFPGYCFSAVHWHGDTLSYLGSNSPTDRGGETRRRKSQGMPSADMYHVTLFLGRHEQLFTPIGNRQQDKVRMPSKSCLVSQGVSLDYLEDKN